MSDVLEPSTELPELNNELKTLIESMANLIVSKDAKIKELEQQLMILSAILDSKTPPTTPNAVPLPYVGCDHVYPQPWYGVFPPSCLKCGQAGHRNLIVTCEGAPDVK